MGNILRAVRVAIAVARSGVSEADRFDLFASQLRAKRPGTFMSEGEVRDAYLQWRLSLERERKVTLLSLKVAGRLAGAGKAKLPIAACALILFALLYPPFHLESGGQSIHLGFGFAFANHPGKVNVMYLALELASIGGLYWLLAQYLALIEAQLDKESNR
jgi:hypothetical protein